MRVYIVIPAHNEEAHLAKTLDSLLAQTHPASKILVVNDSSTDNTAQLIAQYASKHAPISGASTTAGHGHMPGGKVIDAFNCGLESLDDNFDIICKFDADLVFPPTYLEKLVERFKRNENCGMAGGFCTIYNGREWILENMTSRDHLRGALKAYRKACFEDIGGLRSQMGWDTADEMLARYNGWQICTDTTLLVQHLKPTGERYSAKLARMQGKVFRDLRYGIWLSLLAALKLAFRKKAPGFFFECINGYLRGPAEYLLDPEEGRFLRNYRWKRILKRRMFTTS